MTTTTKLTEERKSIKKWLDGNDNHKDYVRFVWDGFILTVYGETKETSMRYTREVLEEYKAL